MATMADVAKRAGVSLSTVSYVLSGKRAISERTRQRVLDAIAEVNFKPNVVAQALAGGRTRTIGLIFPALARHMNGNHLDFVTSAAQTAQARGYSLLISVSPNEEAEVVHMAQRGFTDGIILMEIKVHDPRVQLLREREFPFVMIGHAEDNEGISFVDFDFEQAVFDALRYLAELGHRHVHLINSPPQLVESGYGPAVRALRGYERGLAEFGLTGTWGPCDDSPQAGYNYTRALLERDPACTAIVINQQQLVSGVIEAAQDAGRRIPDDLSLVGIVAAPFAETTTPKLTTIDFPSAEMGRLGAGMLIQQLEGGDSAPTQRLLTAPLTVRHSTGPAPARRTATAASDQ